MIAIVDENRWIMAIPFRCISHQLGESGYNSLLDLHERRAGLGEVESMVRWNTDRRGTL